MDDKDTLCDKLQTCLLPRHFLLDSYSWASEGLMAEETSFKRESKVHPITRRSQWPRGLRRKSAGRSPSEIVCSNPAGGHGCLSVVSVVCCQIEVCATS